ncbi:tetratricopeptide repeat-containing sulfotransferase family protein [Gimibacter soli]|uniref:Sulfotransferase n=1 Tax=Gimibacter soli TaxID=3024400 RepID=A0AAF0BL29_9PROT|nr:tetratricopeptide repeat-containing sulfotransferase family protein [Gimibacter soli]WCL52965.1 sulfotransferase [Gimibacter soli]
MTSPESAEPTGSLATAIAHTSRLLAQNPALAEEQATEILRVVPESPEAALLRAMAVARQGRRDEAEGQFVALLKRLPDYAGAWFELGQFHARAGDMESAVDAVRRAVKEAPGYTQAWLALADMLTVQGKTDEADAAFARHIATSTNDPNLMAAATALVENRLPEAEHLLRAHLKQFPSDVAAMRMLAETGGRLGQYDDAVALLEHCIALAPGFDAARHNLALMLNRNGRLLEALDHLDFLIGKDGNNPNYRLLHAACLSRLGRYEEAIEAYERILKVFDGHPQSWMSYGHALKTVGRQEDGIKAYEKAVAIAPELGEVWWSLANLKTFRFSNDQLAIMEREVKREDISKEDRFHLHFALGKAYEDRKVYSQSFAHYEVGNTERREELQYSAEITSGLVARSKELLTADFFAARQGQGSQAADPIFVVGLPRAGSTLVEQILSSHSMVEGTMELPDIIAIAKELGFKDGRKGTGLYPGSIAGLPADRLKALGEEYLDRTRIQRKEGTPFFIDKMPNNWLHAGLIHLILPNAKIIDARRHPMGCCFSGFKQHFARGQAFTYGLMEIGRYYHDYVDLMSHIDRALPGRIHRVIYERMVEDTETEIRALLDYCGLPFEESCLRYWETDRAVRTASSEQVRKPIFKDAVEHWKNYDPWLAPLREALGPVLSSYPASPFV